MKQLMGRLNWLEDIGMYLGFLGTLLILKSNAAAPNVGTDGFSIMFKDPKYRFLVETDSKLLAWGITFLMLGFLTQMIIRTLERPNIIRVPILASALVFSITIIAKVFK